MFDNLPMGGLRHGTLLSPPGPVHSTPLLLFDKFVSQTEIPAVPSIQLNFLLLSVTTAEGARRCLKLTEDITSDGFHLPVLYTYRSASKQENLQRSLPAIP